MDAGSNEQARQTLHGLVIMCAARRLSRVVAPPSLAVRSFKIGMAVLVVITLLDAVAGGLLRADAPWAELHNSVLAGRAAVAHAQLMLSGFLGTVIALERAVAIKQRWALAAPVISGVASVLMLNGYVEVAALLGICAALIFVAVNGALVAHQPLAHTWLLLVSSLAWLIGNIFFAAGRGLDAVLPWWFAFVILTIAAERLEMSRLMSHHPLALPSLVSIVASLLIGAALSLSAGASAGVLYGVSMTALAIWFGGFDIARRTALAHGLSRYMAVCLLGGYVWLGVAGLAWIGMAVGCPGRDLALHALGLGFIVSMVMGHAPVILPAVARVKLLYGPWFYVPVGLLHASLVLRLFAGIGHPALRTAGAVLNAAALALFAVTIVGSVVAWQAKSKTSNLPQNS